ncbi:hypothetical protein BT93_L2398 [Corymbia citriodora subsp. variegata]|uniref:Uncharacterized protein n=1 Tax=Corymbia citriodora subsp. variegata TaxID=360336 RepID=A0A8T0CJX7_CORYI|nr:hypothetical protein BT93_L2398 [Corymbia citriodora subsp. variegata]
MELAQIYNKMCKAVEDNVHESVQTFYSDSPASHRLRKNLIPLENAFESITRILTPESGDPPKSEDPVVGPGQQSMAESSKTTAASFTQENGSASAAVADTEMQELDEDTSTRESRLAFMHKEFVRDDYVPPGDAAATKDANLPGFEHSSLAGNKDDDVEMKEQNLPDEAANPEPNGAGGASERVIVLDD